MFKSAYPIWLKGLTEETNIQARFTAVLPRKSNATLYVTGATFFKVCFNGVTIHHGPAPTATGYARVDVLPLPMLAAEGGVLSIEVAGYACTSYAAVKQPSYLIAEVRVGDEVIAATGKDFTAYRVASRVRRVFQYSGQRHFSEAWDLSAKDTESEIEICDFGIKYLERKAPMPTIKKELPEGALCVSGFVDTKEYGRDNPYPTTVAVNKADVKFDEYDAYTLSDFMSLDYTIDRNKVEIPGRLCEGEFAVFECNRNSSGLIHLDLIAEQGTRVLIVFDELIDKGRFAFKTKSLNVIDLTCEGDVSFENFDIYGFKYYSVFVLSGAVDLKSVYRLKINHDPKDLPRLNTADEDFLEIYEAALESYRSNSLGIFMDCPTRERAGWLCDSYFISRASYRLTGNTLIEDDFLENFLNHRCTTIPKGMLPMCYPAEHPAGRFIPQWSMWFVLELPEYKKRNPSADLSIFKDTVYGLVGYFEKCENELSLLEDLESWNFVEWSKANDWCEGVNFPTNMLYAAMLCAVDSMYGDKRLSEKAELIRENVRKLSFDGKFFHDQALRNEQGSLVVNDNISEACQYYAFYFGTADETEYAALKSTLINEFGPNIDNYPNIEKANALMGIYLRMDLLYEWNKRELLLDEIKGYFLNMARITGTLWEHKTTAASLNHGFPSYVGEMLLRVLGERTCK